MIMDVPKLLSVQKKRAENLTEEEEIDRKCDGSPDVVRKKESEHLKVHMPSRGSGRNWGDVPVGQNYPTEMD